ncbi:MAG: PAS domain-containing protein [Chloroflexi bacterium]|nr:PAS domain-containing protein [Chloroflexota bacterium]
MTPDGLFGWLTSAPCGAFAVSLDQTIVFWNGGARAILGYSAGRVVGLKCYEVMAGADDSGLTPDCAGGCACLRYARVGMVPAPTDMMMRCASGARKLVKVQPMVVSGVGDSGPLVVYLFGDAPGESRSGAVHWELGQRSSEGPLTAREIEVLRYLALGWDVAHIATELGLSPHTVRNHSTNLRRKLDVSSSLEAVMAAVRLGILTLEAGSSGDGS